MKPINNIPGLVQELYRIVSDLESLFPGRRFTPDGHLVGSLGEVIAAHQYDLELFPASHEGHDAKSPDGRLVQIKATQVKSIAMRSRPDNLIAIRILPDGSFEEVYNGPGDIVWQNAGKMQSNGQRPITLAKLSKLMKTLPPKSRISKSAT
jgi:hypothetical protein